MQRFFVEIKTTGLSAENHQVIEVGVLNESGGQLLFRMKPTQDMESEVLSLNGLSLEELAAFPLRGEGLADLQIFLLHMVSGEGDFQFVVYIEEFFLPFWEKLMGELSISQNSSFQALKDPNVLSLMPFARDYTESEGNVLKNYKKSTVCSALLSKPYTGLTDLRDLYHFLEVQGVPFSKEGAFLEKLNDSQKSAVLSPEGALLILAGAGSGKTRVIVSKILYAIEHQRISPSRILAVTFTNKAAKEMRERLEEELPRQKIQKLTIGTFHSLGLRILREEHSHWGYVKEFSVFGESEKEGMVRDVLLELKIAEDVLSINQAKVMITKMKNAGLQGGNSNSYSPYDGEIYDSYEKKLFQYQGFDFDDLIHKPVVLMNKNEEIRNKWGHFFQYIFVDEYQDTNDGQFQMLQLLSRGSGNLCVVGDDDQSIYGFRGADVGHILSFEQRFPKAQKILLDYNYRNAPHILKAAMALISHNSARYEKKILSGRDAQKEEKIFYYEAENREKEGEWLASEIFSNRIDRSVPYSEQAILCRTNTQMRPLEKALRQQNIPYRVIGGYSFFDRAEVKHVFAYLRLIYNPHDTLAFYRAIQFPKRGIGEKTLLLLSEYAVDKKVGILDACADAGEIEGVGKKATHELQQFLDMYKNIRDVLENSGTLLSQVVENLYIESGIQEEIYRVYRDDADGRLRSLKEILDDIQKRERRKTYAGDGRVLLGQYLQDTILAQLKDEEETADKVSLITIHSAKGLEFRTIFIPGFQEGIFPHEKSKILGESGILEERRLCYVAFTRAKDFLFLSMHKEKFGSKTEGEAVASRFLQEIPEDILEQVEDETSALDEMEYLKKMREILEMKE